MEEAEKKEVHRFINENYEPVKNKQEANWIVTTAELAGKLETVGQFILPEHVHHFLVENDFTSITVEGTVYWLLKEK